MSCASFDWKAYALGEMSPSGRRQAEAHAGACAACREELAGLRLTLDAMSTLRDEEIPRRIAFVSDQVFEPRWWRALLNPTFSAACVLAAAILVHAFAGPSSAEIDAAVARAVAQVEASHAQQAQEMLAAYEFTQKQMRQMYKTASGIVLQ
jgi:anti-sigma factor RsiW